MYTHVQLTTLFKAPNPVLIASCFLSMWGNRWFSLGRKWINLFFFVLMWFKLWHIWNCLFYKFPRADYYHHVHCFISSKKCVETNYLVARFNNLTLLLKPCGVDFFPFVQLIISFSQWSSSCMRFSPLAILHMVTFSFLRNLWHYWDGMFFPPIWQRQ